MVGPRGALGPEAGEGGAASAEPVERREVLERPFARAGDFLVGEGGA